MENLVAASGGIIWLALSLLSLVLCLFLALAPLFVWKWTKATKEETTRLNDNLIVLVTMLKRWETRYLLVDGEQTPKSEGERLHR